MIGLIIIIVMVLIVWVCIKWWAGVAVKGGYSALSGANDTVTKSYYTHFEVKLTSYNTVEKVENELRRVKFIVVGAA